MAKVKLEIVTAEKLIYSEDVDMVVAPGVDGYLGILPHHTPLMTMLNPGELRIKNGGEEIEMAITGGFMEVRPDKVVVLADAAERAEEIDIARAEAAKKRAEERLAGKVPEGDLLRAQASLMRALMRLKVAEKRRRRGKL
ncbi:MAG: F0F1 ATP synthase subunit epsilon [Dehalococcoidia bacterium]|nr:atpC [Dehalococcoidia bacterium]MDO8635020.1 F0F1 ATP synthase subunit epsilon [Dehalococcoidia bacterium]